MPFSSISLLETKKMFYDNYTQADVEGLFSYAHFIYIAVFFLGAALAIYKSRNFSKKQERRVRLIIAITVTVLESVKIGLRLYKQMGPDTWLPLYYCSIFIFAIWISLVPYEPIARLGKIFMAMGGIFAAAVFAIMPTTSLAVQPALHPATMYSYVYHFLMLYAGFMLFLTDSYKPKTSDSIGYFLLILAVSVPSAVINYYHGTNCMFLNYAYGLPFLQPILDFSHTLYMIVMFLAEGVLMFFVNYLIYKAVVRLHVRASSK